MADRSYIAKGSQHLISAWWPEFLNNMKYNYARLANTDKVACALKKKKKRSMSREKRENDDLYLNSHEGNKTKNIILYSTFFWENYYC